MNPKPKSIQIFPPGGTANQTDAERMSAVSSAIVLPDASQHTFPHLEETIGGVREMKRFWRSGDPTDLPENPELVVVMDWVNRIADEEGFDRLLPRLALSHGAVMETILGPARDGDLSGIPAAHPLVLVHCLWRISVEIARCGYDEMRRPVGDEEFWGAGQIWQNLRSKLAAGGYEPRLQFGRTGTDPRPTGTDSTTFAQ